MAGEKFVANDAIRDAVKGRESEILDKLGIDWRSGTSPAHTPLTATTTRAGAGTSATPALIAPVLRSRTASLIS